MGFALNLTIKLFIKKLNMARAKFERKPHVNIGTPGHVDPTVKQLLQQQLQ
jgi:hypothetical protein